jgi:hypothetical protein
MKSLPVWTYVAAWGFCVGGMALGCVAFYFLGISWWTPVDFVTFCGRAYFMALGLFAHYLVVKNYKVN